MVVNEQLLMKYLTTLPRDSAEYAQLATVCVILNVTDNVSDVLRNDEGKFEYYDERLIDSILSISSPKEASQLLWGAIGFCLPPTVFECHWRRAILNTNDPSVIHSLAGALSDYIRLHPGTIQVPRDLIDALLQLPSDDSIIVGIRLLTRGNFDSTEVFVQLDRAIKSDSKRQQLAGLFLLNEILSERIAHDKTAFLGPDFRSDLVDIGRRTTDPDVASGIESAIKWIRHWE